MAAKNNYVYVCNQDFYILDVSNPATPFEVGHYPAVEGTPASCKGLQVGGNYLYANYQNNKFTKALKHLFY